MLAGRDPAGAGNIQSPPGEGPVARRVAITAPRGPEETARRAVSHPAVEALLGAVEGFAIVLDRDRRILAANDRFVALLGAADAACLRGARPGEVLGCRNAKDGCGDSPQCSSCGLLRALPAPGAAATGRAVDWTVVTDADGRRETREFSVQPVPLCVDGEDLTLLLFRDVSVERHRDALARLFLHDVANTLGGLLGWCRVLERAQGAAARRAVRRVCLLTRQLEREITDQRLLLEAERGELQVATDLVRPSVILTLLRRLFAGHRAAARRRVVVRVDEDLPLATDAALVLRILANFVKNALEAVPPGACVRVRYRRTAQGGVFRVWNAGVIAPEARERIFRRSFTTKAGRGRGLGTWGARLLGERYLGGRVGFSSSEAGGTAFHLVLPDPRARG